MNIVVLPFGTRIDRDVRPRRVRIFVEDGLVVGVPATGWSIYFPHY